ncbi:tRNA hydroxylase [Pseudoalteromonas sp. PS1M3]|nr:tRNA hydroxylase [Pseudoalteromonas sp. PS1M3]
MSHSQLLEPIHDFLLCKTPTQWVDKAIKKENLSVILIDHLICELNDNMCIFKFSE